MKYLIIILIILIFYNFYQYDTIKGLEANNAYLSGMVDRQENQLNEQGSRILSYYNEWKFCEKELK